MLCGRGGEEEESQAGVGLPGKALSAHQREHTRVFARPGRAGQGRSQAGGKEGTTAVVWAAGYCTGWAWEEWEDKEEGEEEEVEERRRTRKSHDMTWDFPPLPSGLRCTLKCLDGIHLCSERSCSGQGQGLKGLSQHGRLAGQEGVKEDRKI
ncbi:hypothetical protein E2C01_050232 [Portunus trituberculatus]|uniref:Uncharacterized protein n=1 Tax=Portunus trituberculatus TaxID=210409 RepID=A0A5B7GFI6_PORTR|nr:hypothetical protein [Portunus trituberculatus]